MIRLEKIDGLPPPIAEKLAPMLGVEWRLTAEAIKNGEMELFAVNGDSYAVTRIEEDLNELVIVAYIGEGALEFAKAMVKAAKKNGLDSVRFLTQRRGLIRWAKRFGKPQVDYVVRVMIGE